MYLITMWKSTSGTCGGRLRRGVRSDAFIYKSPRTGYVSRLHHTRSHTAGGVAGEARRPAAVGGLSAAGREVFAP
ncbi:hypothetical protein EVAR_23287_1 [Eumeta japonica]|uniref:Uncharacterized protein n=1 Tax=Eumeta variegata TaxID=151549 RepID=A0A4C1V618_EUMVA|nr:hypothetical protein EVAR_23287_1 [Eumeta japonica]